MKQIFPNGTNQLLTDDFEPYFINLFNWIEFPYFPTITQEEVSVVPVNGVFTNLRVKASDSINGSIDFETAPGTNEILLTLNSAEVEKLSNGDREVTAGDVLTLRGNITSLPTWTDRSFQWGILFTPSDGVSGVMISTQPDDSIGLGSFGTRVYNHINTLEQGWTNPESRRYFVAPMDLTITNFYAYMEQTVNSTTLSWSIYKNGSEEASTIITYNAGQRQTKSVTGLSISVSQGDTLTFSGIATGAASELGAMSLAFSYTPANPDEFMMGGFANNLSTVQNTVQYGPINGSDNGFSTEDKYPVLISENCRLKNFTVKLETAPGASQTRVFTLRRNGANATSTVTISGTDTVEIDSTNIDNLDLGDTINVSFEPTTAACAATRAFWSAVIYDVSTNNILARPIYFN